MEQYLFEHLTHAQYGQWDDDDAEVVEGVSSAELNTFNLHILLPNN